MTAAHDVLIVGAGHGGAQVAIGLRQAGFTGSIALVGDEHSPPYERPPLSKDYLGGVREFGSLLLRPEAFWREHAIDLLLGRRVVRVEPATHLVAADTGEVLGYGRLVWAAGGTPRRLACPGHHLRRQHVIRNRGDVDALVAAAAAGYRVVVVGAGYIGLESAATLSKLGKQVTVLEAQDRVLARVAGPTVSRFFEAAHRARGVDIMTGVGVSSIEGDGDVAVGVRLDDGVLLPADIIIIGVGIEPAVGPLRAAGARGGDGVEVDACCLTSLPDIYAIGDCAAHRSRHGDGSFVRIESVQNATDQAMAVAKTLSGHTTTYDAVPWFWSNQYDLRLQAAGLSHGYDEEIVRGDPGSGRFSVVYRREGRIIALDCINAPRDYVQGKALLQRTDLDRALIADTGIALRELAVPAEHRAEQR